MSHFVRCDRCSIEDHVTGTVSLPPGWQKICNADLCEPCCMLVRDFIRFTSAHAAALPVEPIPTGPASDKLFETTPEESADDRSNEANPAIPVVDSTPEPASEHGDTVRADKPPLETSTEERMRTRATKRRKKLLGPDAPPDKRTGFPHGANEVQS